jgi:hypothetical protein
MLSIHILNLLLLTIDTCSALGLAENHKMEIEIEGFLYFGSHTMELKESSSPAGKRDCAIFFIGPGTPDFMRPGILESQLSVDRLLIDRVKQYARRVEADPDHLSKVKVKGIMFVAKDFVKNQGRGNGYGYRGSYKAAILVRNLEFIDSK